MNNAARFALCQSIAAAMVKRYRSEAPEGCDPQNTYVALAGTVISVGVGAYQAHKQSQAAKKANAGGVPQAAEYVPVDFGDMQMQTVADNYGNMGGIRTLNDLTNTVITNQDMKRARKFIPNFKQFLRQESMNTGSLLKGNLPYDDVLDIASNRNSLSNSLGTPGAGGPATLRDLGLSRLSAMKEGAGMLSSMVNNAETVSPIARYSRPQDSFLSPRETIPWEIEQRQLEQQSLQNRYNLEAGVSPTSLARQAGQMSGASSPLGTYASGIGQIAAAYGRTQGAGGMGGATAGMSGGGGYASDLGAMSAAPTAAAYSYDPTIGYTPIPYRADGYSIAA